MIILLQVSLHLLSPITRGLARRGILQSGTLNAPWSWMSGEKAAEVARKLIDDVGCNATKLPDAPLKVSQVMSRLKATLMPPPNMFGIESLSSREYE